MVSTDDLQNPSTDMSKIIVAMGIGLFSLLVLNIFDLLSFWTLVAVLVGVALVLKFGVPSVGMVVALVIVAMVLYSIGQFLSPATEVIFGKKTYTSDASLDQGMDYWEGTGGAGREGGRFVIPPRGSLTRTKGFDRATLMTVKLVNVKVDDPEKEGEVNVLIEDLYDYPANHKNFLGCTYQRNARFSFSVSDEGITSSNEAEFGNSMDEKELVWYQDRKDEKYKGLGHCFTCSVRLYYLITSYGSDGNFSYYQWQICTPGYWSRDIPRPYRVTISNSGKEGISYDAVISGVRE